MQHCDSIHLIHPDYNIVRNLRIRRGQGLRPNQRENLGIFAKLRHDHNHTNYTIVVRTLHAGLRRVSMDFGVNTRLRFGDLGRCRLWVVVVFDLWKVRGLRVMHTDREGGWLGSLLNATPLRNSERRQVVGVFCFVSGRPLTDVVTAVQHGQEGIRVDFAHWPEKELPCHIGGVGRKADKHSDGENTCQHTRIDTVTHQGHYYGIGSCEPSPLVIQRPAHSNSD